MTIEEGPFDSPGAEARAEADVVAGRLVSHGAVRRWLASWASGKRVPRPHVGD